MLALPIIEALNSQIFHCSPAVREHEPGFNRLKTGLSYPPDGVSPDGIVWATSLLDSDFQTERGDINPSLIPLDSVPLDLVLTPPLLGVGGGGDVLANADSATGT